MNPRIVGSMVDESGTIVAGKLVWRDDAWTQLLFRDTTIHSEVEDDNLVRQSWEDLAAFDNDSLRVLEEQLLYSRFTLTFGWSSKLERLCILGVEW